MHHPGGACHWQRAAKVIFRGGSQAAGGGSVAARDGRGLGRQRPRRLVRGAFLAADRRARGDDAGRPGAHLRHRRRRQADRLLHLRRLGSVARHRPRVAPDAAEHDADRHLLRLAAGAARGWRRVPRRRRQLDRHRHDQHRQQQLERVLDRRQHAHARQQHEPRALVFQHDDAAERRALHPGRLERHRSPRGARPATGSSACWAAPTPARCSSSTRATSSRRTAACSATTATVASTTSIPPAPARSRSSASCCRRRTAAAMRPRRCSAPGGSCRLAARPVAPS